VDGRGGNLGEGLDRCRCETCYITQRITVAMIRKHTGCRNIYPPTRPRRDYHSPPSSFIISKSLLTTAVLARSASTSSSVSSTLPRFVASSHSGIPMVTVLHSRVGESMLMRVTIPVSANRGRRTIRVGAEGSAGAHFYVSDSVRWGLVRASRQTHRRRARFGTRVDCLGNTRRVVVR